MKRVCAVPDCGNPLHHTNRSAVCRWHNHHPDFCRCAICTGAGAKPQPVEREGIRVEERRVTSAGYSTCAGVMHRISLPREPWA